METINPIHHLAIILKNQVIIITAQHIVILAAIFIMMINQTPVSMYFRNNEWSIDEMFEIMKEIAETSLRYYIF
ncbi:hypothetical protein [Campylobacter hyointestinalis]|uniref:hypothetical protein n=1 Tax=Campylobacter hyointestinalis TaxID=198 RepID=UPI0021571F98|nr:hypothetical protein [Campylobacter hyointestinalis]